MCRQRDQLLAPVVEVRIGHNQERVRPLLRHGRENRFEVAFGGGGENGNVLTSGTRGSFYITRVGQSLDIIRIDEDGDEFCIGNKLAQHFEPFRPQRVGKQRDAGELPPGRLSLRQGRTIPDHRRSPRRSESLSLPPWPPVADPPPRN